MSEKKKKNPVLNHALQTPSIKKLAGKRVVLASASPRRREILRTFVRPKRLTPFQSSLKNLNFIQGLEPEIVPSNFEEDLPLSSFQDIHEYPVSTATYKAVDVYERLVVSQRWICVKNF